MRITILATLVALFLAAQAKANTVEHCKGVVQVLDVGLEAHSNGVDMLDAAELMLQTMSEINLSMAGPSDEAAYGFAAIIYSNPAIHIFGDRFKAEAMAECLNVNDE